MSTISQSIPNLLLGISQQPDNRKRPGQVKDALNVFPDFALGMLKRPGGNFVTKLEGASPTGKYFPILRDQNEKYLGQYEPSTSSFNVWGLVDGKPRAVDMGTNTGVPATCSISSNGPVFSSLLTVVDGLGVASTTKANGFDGTADLSDVNTTFCEASAIDTTLDITWGAGPFNVTYHRLEILVTALTNQIEFDGTTLDNSNFLNDWVQLDSVADGTGTFDNKTIRITPDAGQTARFAAIRIDGWKVLKDNDPDWNLKTASDAFKAAQITSDTVEADVLVKETLLAKAIDALTPVTTSRLEFDYQAFSIPKRDSYGNYNRPFIKTGVIEYEGNSQQATATATLTNTITDVGVSSSGSGYASAPTVTISGSGNGATATAVLSDIGNLSAINITNDGAEYIDVPTVSFGGGLSGYQGTAVVNWFTKKVTKVLVEDGDVIDITDENERYEIAGNIGKHDSLYGGIDGDFESQDLIGNNRGYNTGRPNITFSDGSSLTTGNIGLYLKPRDLTGKSKIRIMAVTGNRTNIGGIGNAPANRVAPASGLDTVDGGNNGTYQMGTYNGGSYNDFGSGFNSLGIPTLDIYIAKEGVTSINNQGNVNPVWNGNQPSGGPPDSQFLAALPRFSGQTDWRHIGEIIPASPATNTDKPYYLSEYEFNIPADLQTTGCYICIGASNQTPSIGQPDTSSRFAVTTLTLVNATPTTTNIADSTVTFNVNPKSANAQSLFPVWNTVHSAHPFYFGKTMLFRNGTVTPTTPTTTAVADVILAKSVKDLTLTNAGSGYNVGQATTISLTGGNPTVVAVPTITVTPTINVVITDKGKGYLGDPIAAVVGGGGTGAVATVTKAYDGIDSIEVTGGDSNYTVTPNILISAPDVPRPFEDNTLVLKDGVFLDNHANYVEIKNMSMNLTASTATDLATTTNGNGTGITVDLTVTAGQVTAASINTNGTGYWDGDELYIAGYPDVILSVRGLARGKERTRDHPDWGKYGIRTWELQETFAIPANAAADKATAQTNYDNAVVAQIVAAVDYDNKKQFYDLQKSLCNITTVPTNAYLKDATVDDVTLTTFNDYTIILNKKKKVQLLSTKTPNFTNHGIVVIQVASNSISYGCTLTRDGQTPDPFSITSPSSAANSSGIAAQLAAAIDANSNYTATSSGPTVIIEATVPFSLSTEGGAVTESLFGFTDTISNVSNLPLHCKDGYIVKVGNSADTTLDDMYVKFSTSGTATLGVGSWDEAPAPDIEFKFDPLTLPHALISQADGTFKVEPINWNDRVVGDDDTNPAPSFVGSEITSVFFYRNRLGFLSGQNVILSQAGDLFNFWVETARTAVASDPIDISAAGKQPVFLNYVAPTSVGLVLYSVTEQFLLSTDSDVLSPSTAKLNQLSSYECDAAIEAVSLGTSQAFISKTPLYTRLFELSDISQDQPPVKSDITDVVPELIPSSSTSVVSSPSLSLVSIGEVGKADVYQYRFLSTSRDERILNSWYRWSLTGTLLSQFFDASTYYAISKNGTDVCVQSFDMTQSSEQGFLTLPTGERTDVCLDLFKVNPFRSYDSVTAKTRFLVPLGEIAGAEFVVVDLGGYVGDANTQSAQSNGAIIKPAIQTTVSGVPFVDLTGDLRGHNIVTGYIYNMEVELPQLYRYSTQDNNIVNDDVSSLILHRLKVKTGLSGPVVYQVSITGKNDWANAVTHTYPNQYQLNNVNMQAKATHVVPVFQRNESLAVKIIGNSPFPVSLLGLDWEGKFNQRFYRRG